MLNIMAVAYYALASRSELKGGVPVMMRFFVGYPTLLHRRVGHRKFMAAYYYTSQHGAGFASATMTANAGVFHGSAHRNATRLIATKPP